MLIAIFKYIVAEALFLLNTACSQIVTFCFDLVSGQTRHANRVKYTQVPVTRNSLELKWVTG